MREEFQSVNNQVRIENLAVHLLGQPIRHMYRYPGEKTPSIRIYSQTNSFFDFGRAVGGDPVRLWSHIRHVDNWVALQEIRSLYGLSDEPDRENIKERIRQQEKAQESAKQAEEERKERWRNEVSFWKKISAACENIIQQSEPLSDAWCFAINERQFANYKLDCLCGLI